MIDFTVNLLFSMEGPRLTEAQATAFSSLAQWTVLNEREGRLLVDGIGSKANIDTVLAMLAQYGRDPRIVGAWYPDGALVAAYPFDLAPWLVVAPDELDLTDPDNPIATRPTAFRETHGWAGWAPKYVPEA